MSNSISVLNILQFIHFSLVISLFHLVGQDIREKFSGAVEAFSRRNTSAHGRHGEQSRHRSSEKVPSSKDVVIILRNHL